MYDVNYTEILSKNVHEADASWPIQSCKFGYEFDHSEIPYTTIATEVKQKKITPLIIKTKI